MFCCWSWVLGVRNRCCCWSCDCRRDCCRNWFWCWLTKDCCCFCCDWSTPPVLITVGLCCCCCCSSSGGVACCSWCWWCCRCCCCCSCCGIIEDCCCCCCCWDHVRGNCWNWSTRSFCSFLGILEFKLGGGMAWAWKLSSLDESLGLRLLCRAGGTMDGKYPDWAAEPISWGFCCCILIHCTRLKPGKRGLWASLMPMSSPSHGIALLKAFSISDSSSAKPLLWTFGKKLLSWWCRIYNVLGCIPDCKWFGYLNRTDSNHSPALLNQNCLGTKTFFFLAFFIHINVRMIMIHWLGLVEVRKHQSTFPFQCHPKSPT